MIFFKRLASLVLCIILLSFSCYLSNTKNSVKPFNDDELVVNIHNWILNFEGHDTLVTPNYLLYSDSFQLIRSHEYYSNYFGDKLDTAYMRPNYYRFDDLRNKVGYFYKTFESESKLLGKFSLDLPYDSFDINVNVFNLISMEKIKDSSFFLQKLSDTSIDGELFSRNRIEHNKEFYIYWSQKNDLLLPFSYLPRISKQTGLAYVLKEIYIDKDYTLPVGGFRLSVQRTNFTDEERSVFNAWKQNCIKYKNKKMGKVKGAKW